MDLQEELAKEVDLINAYLVLAGLSGLRVCPANANNPSSKLYLELRYDCCGGTVLASLDKVSLLKALLELRK